MTLAPLDQLLDKLGPDPGADEILSAFETWSASRGRPLYPHQYEAAVAILSEANAVVTTPTGSGKSLIATAAQLATMAAGGRTYYTAPIKALVSEKFFACCDDFGAKNVGMVTGDAAINADAPIICCTAEILANIALREGKTADLDCVIMDEFHFISEPDRGWAWQVALSELPQAQFVIMSATLGDVSQLISSLTDNTGRETIVISDAARPVPLQYSWSMMPLPEKLDELISTGQAPIYLVHPSQGAATEQAQSMASAKLVDTARRHEIVEAIGNFRFAPGFGKTLRTLLTNGIGVHHAGLLPKYRRLVETLAQRGLLRVICGTDTLGVGINVPIRTVLFTTLAKFDGRRERLLRSREFHQIAGRAGRAGFDPIGYVVAQAPEYQIENERIAQKFANDEKKLKSVRKKKPPEGAVNYTEASFEKLINSTPETLHARMQISHAMLLNLLDRDQDTAEAVVHIVDAATQVPSERRKLYRRAIALARSLLNAGVVVRREQPTPGGRKYDLADDLQRDFALNQPLSAFAMAVIESLDTASPTHALDVVSVIEATLEDPLAILIQQEHKARGEAIAEMKADGLDYTERMQLAEEISWPQPLADELGDALAELLPRHPWLGEHPLRPKSIVRDMYERAMTFGEYVAFYKAQRSEGLLLRYLSDAWRALRQTVPSGARDESLDDLIAWLGEIVTMTDSSLVDEWEELTDPSREPAQLRQARETEARPLTSNVRAFRVLVRNAMFRRVQLAAEDDVEQLAELGPDDPWTIDDWDDALGDYWDEHDEIDTGPEARSPALFIVDDSEPRLWRVRQIIADPEGNHDWQMHAEVDLDASDDLGSPAVQVTWFGRVGSAP